MSLRDQDRGEGTSERPPLLGARRDTAGEPGALEEPKDQENLEGPLGTKPQAQGRCCHTAETSSEDRGTPGRTLSPGGSSRGHGSHREAAARGVAAAGGDVLARTFLHDGD